MKAASLPYLSFREFGRRAKGWRFSTTKHKPKYLRYLIMDCTKEWSFIAKRWAIYALRSVIGIHRSEEETDGEQGSNFLVAPHSVTMLIFPSDAPKHLSIVPNLSTCPPNVLYLLPSTRSIPQNHFQSTQILQQFLAMDA